MTTRLQICLTAIVKNEAASIRPWLDSVIDHIDTWVIMDTGSTDSTKADIKAYFAGKGIPGTLIDGPFHDFSQARNLVISQAEAWTSGVPGSLLLLDADMRLVATDNTWRAGNTRDIGLMRVREPDGTTYWLPLLRRVGCGLQYSGATHEALPAPFDRTAKIVHASIDHLANGSNRAEKYERDRLILEAVTRRNPADARAWFYLGQTYMGLGHWGAAKNCYDRRAAMGGWDEEVWFARLQSARCSRRISTISVAVSQTLAVFEARPTRAEPLADLVEYMLELDQPQAAKIFRDRIQGILPPNDVLFVDPWAYDLPYRHGTDMNAKAGKWPLVEQRAEWCEQNHIGDPRFWLHWQVKALWEMGAKDAAIQKAEAGLRLRPEHASLAADLAVMRGLVDGEITPS